MTSAAVTPIRGVPSVQDGLTALDHYIKEPPETSRVFTFTPKMAATILGLGGDGVGRNTHNRNRKLKKINEYADDMTDNQWRLTGDTIKFTQSGALGDGQNRLFACAKSKKSFRTHVVFGIADDVFPWLDKGKQRSIGDDFFIDGMENPVLLGHIVRWLELFRLGTVKERTTFTREQVREAFKTYDRELISLAMEKGLEVQKANPVNPTPRSIAAAFYYLFAQRDKTLADEFFAAWSGSASQADRMLPIKKANATFTLIRKNNPTVRINDVMRAAVWVIAWNFVVGKKPGNAAAFKWSTNEPFPKIKG